MIDKMFSTPFVKPSILDQFVFYIKVFLVLNLTFTMIIILLCIGWIFPYVRNFFPIYFHKLLVWLLSIKIECEGDVNKSKSCNLFVSNHQSYIDIPILGSQFQLRFIAKSEVKFWPILGFLAKMGKTIFIKRVRLKSLIQKNIIFSSLSRGNTLMIFPEATSSDGNRVLPFKSNSFAALENQDFLIQPIVLFYSDINGMPINRWLRPIIAWYGDMDLKPHFSILKNLKSINVKIFYLKSVNSKDFSNRKELSNYLGNEIQDVYSRALSRKKLAE